MPSREAHQAVTELMRRQALSQIQDVGLDASLSPLALPLRTAYIDEDSGRLVIGLDGAAQSDRAAHERALRHITKDVEIELRYVQVIRDTCPDKKQDCRPLRGGVRMNGDATMNLVIMQRIDGQKVAQTITSSHAVGTGTGQNVGQSPKINTYGKVVRNPSLTNRASDAALTDINRRVEGSPYTIWHGSNVPDYIVNDFAHSSNVPLYARVHLQGAMRDGLSQGRIEQIGVTVTDKFGTLNNQIYASYEAAGGDSGGPVFYFTDQELYVVYVGIHAGRVVENGQAVSYYSPWEGIEADLQLELVR